MLMLRNLLFGYCFLFLSTVFGQPLDLHYYLPKITYDVKITTPKQFLGFEVGERHVSPDQLYYYMKQLELESNRIKLIEYARTFEGRPLICLIITSQKNQSQLDDLRMKHLQWIDPNTKSNTTVDQTPLVLYQGYSIHGNEASGSNAALAMAYYLAAGQDAELDQLLDKTIILFDPCFNPDGGHRFATWVNAHKSQSMVSDPVSREFSEPWPRGRTNHYWFDLNRDWMPQQLPESKGRVRLYHHWMPNILTDHHEMGSNATFFFMPGEPTRVNPNTPKMNQELTGEIGKYHSASLNTIGSLYYTREGYDDYYYGKGSTYPDVNGGVGILFEQASSRGHAQQTNNGLLTLSFAVRNQVRASFSTYKAAVELRTKLLIYQRDFYKTAIDESNKDAVKGYLVSASKDHGRMNQFLDILLANKIKVYHLKENKNLYSKDDSYIIPTAQLQYRMIKGMFEKRTSFEDSLFYDISAWTLPLAFNLNYTELNASDQVQNLMGAELLQIPVHVPSTIFKSDYAYALEWTSYYAPKALYMILEQGIRVKTIHDDFTLNTAQGDKLFKRGTLLIPVQSQSKTSTQIHQLLTEINSIMPLQITALHTGLAIQGVDLGSPSSTVIQKPKLAMIVGDGVDPNDAGEVWHLLDERMAMPITLIDINTLQTFNPDEYNTLVLVDGNYQSISASSVSKIKAWLTGGGTIIAMGRSISWLVAQSLSSAIVKPTISSFDVKSGETPMRSYANASADVGTDLLAGAIFNTRFDPTHPLAYGYDGHTLPMFKPTKIYLDIPKNAYAAPFRYMPSPLMSGYVSKVNLDLIKGSAAVMVSGMGSGKVINIPDNPNFRAFWYGTNRLFLNSIFLGPAINGTTVQRSTD